MDDSVKNALKRLTGKKKLEEDKETNNKVVIKDETIKSQNKPLIKKSTINKKSI